MNITSIGDSWYESDGPDEVSILLFLGAILFGVLLIGPLGRTLRTAVLDVREWSLVEHFLREGDREGSRLRREASASETRGTGDGPRDPLEEGERAAARAEADGEGICPICLAEPPENPIETSCRHLFCSECYSGYWEHTFRPNPVRCPVCRRDVDLISASSPSPAPSTLTFVDQYNAVCGGGGGVGAVATEAPWLLSRLFHDPTGIRSIVCSSYAFFFLAPIVSSLAYAFLPVDLIPDASLPFLGFIDDIIVIIVALVIMAGVYRAWVVEQARLRLVGE